MFESCLLLRIAIRQPLQRFSQFCKRILLFFQVFQCIVIVLLEAIFTFIGLLQYVLGIFQLRHLQRREFYEIGISTIVVFDEIAQALGHHFFFQEFDFCFIGRLCHRVITEVDELFPKLSEPRRKLGAYRDGAAVSIRDIAITRYLRSPGAIVIAAANGDGFLAMNAGFCFTIHHYVSRGIDDLLADGAALSANGIAQSAQPILHLTGAPGSDCAGIGFEMDVSITLNVRILLHVQRRGAIGSGHGILLDGNRDGRGVQDVAVSSDTDGAIISIGIAPCHDRDIALGCFGGGIKIRPRRAGVSHLIFRACITRQPIDIHDGFTFDGGIVAAAHSNGAARVGDAMAVGIGAAIAYGGTLFVCLIHVPGEKLRLTDLGGGSGGDGLGILHMRRADCRTGGQGAAVFGNNIAMGLDGDGILIIESLAGCDFLLRQIRAVGLDGLRANIHAGVV